MHPSPEDYTRADRLASELCVWTLCGPEPAMLTHMAMVRALALDCMEERIAADWVECGGCSCYHPPGYTGDCRDNANRWPVEDNHA